MIVLKSVALASMHEMLITMRANLAKYQNDHSHLSCPVPYVETCKPATTSGAQRLSHRHARL
jgi:hypothetical protein